MLTDGQPLTDERRQCTRRPPGLDDGVPRPPPHQRGRGALPDGAAQEPRGPGSARGHGRRPSTRSIRRWSGSPRRRVRCTRRSPPHRPSSSRRSRSWRPSSTRTCGARRKRRCHWWRLASPRRTGTAGTRSTTSRVCPSASSPHSGLWTLDGQDPVSHALMSQVVPRPVLFVITTVFGPRYRRKTARLWGGTRAAAVGALTKDMVEVAE